MTSKISTTRNQHSINQVIDRDLIQTVAV